MLPDKYKLENSESSQKKFDDAKKVAAAGLEGRGNGIFTRGTILECNAVVRAFIQLFGHQYFQNTRCLFLASFL